MPNPESLALTDLLVKLRVDFATEVDFSSRDPSVTLAKVRLITAAATYFNILAISDFGGRSGPVRAEGLVEQIVGAAFQTFGGEDPRPDPFEKAAMLLRGITQGHPFHDGNKRTGFLTVAYFLEHVGHPLPRELDIESVVSLCMRVSSGDLRDLATIAEAIRQCWGQAS